MHIPPETLWSERLREYAYFVAASHATDARRQDVEFLLCNVNARRTFLDRWRTWRSYFRRCAVEPGWLHNDPERIDEAVVTLQSYTRFVSREQWTELHAILDEIAYLADRTRSLRQQLHVSRLRPIASA